MEEAIGRSEETHSKETPIFTVTDKRFWVKQEGGDSSETGKEEVPSQYPTYVEQLRTQLEEQEKKLQRHLQKLAEDNDEFRKRIERDLQKQIAIYKGKFLEKLLPVVDNLERALASAQTSENFSAFLEGIQLVHMQFLAQLKEEGVEQIEALHRPFDPATDEAVGIEEVRDPAKDNMVLHELEKGYFVQGKLLRPARVIVGKAQGEASAENIGEEEGNTRL